MTAIMLHAPQHQAAKPKVTTGWYFSCTIQFYLSLCLAKNKAWMKWWRGATRRKRHRARKPL